MTNNAKNNLEQALTTRNRIVQSLQTMVAALETSEVAGVNNSGKLELPQAIAELGNFMEQQAMSDRDRTTENQRLQTLVYKMFTTSQNIASLAQTIN